MKRAGVIWAGSSTSKLKVAHRAVGRGFKSSHVGIQIGLLMTELGLPSEQVKRKKELKGNLRIFC